MLYVGTNTKRDRNPLYTWPDYFTNGFAELVAKQSYYLTQHYRFVGSATSECPIWLTLIAS